MKVKTMNLYELFQEFTNVDELFVQDGIHLSATANDMIADKLAPLVEELPIKFPTFHEILELGHFPMERMWR